MAASPVLMPRLAGLTVDNRDDCSALQRNFSGSDVIVDSQVPFPFNSDAVGQLHQQVLNNLSFNDQIQIGFFGQLPYGPGDEGIGPSDTVVSATSGITPSSRTISFDGYSDELVSPTKSKLAEPPLTRKRIATHKAKLQELQEQQPQATKKKPKLSQEKASASRRNKSLERNRVAASKSRQKKKQRVHELENRKAELEAQHQTLRREHMQLVEEITLIKERLTNHAKCNDLSISSWIESEAIKFLQKSARKRSSLQLRY